MKKDYIVPSIKTLSSTEESIICVSNFERPGDGNQLSNQGMFDENTQEDQTVWDL